jgi:hypothetical membrane protein
MKSRFWQTKVYRYIIVGCGLFLVLTVAAMFAYPGGNFKEELTTGYDFFHNFFSDLGRITVVGGRSNLVSAALFWTGLTLAGSGLVLFFIAFRLFFRAERVGRFWSDLGSVVGVISGLCFVGIACAPYDVFFALHYNLVFWAFRTFLVAVAIYTYVIFRQSDYPRVNGWVFVFFTVMLAAYMALLEFGPSAKTDAGLVIQATGQKIIVYVSIGSVVAQSWLAVRFRERSVVQST